MTPLHVSSKYGHYDITDFLIKTGANPNIKNAKSIFIIFLN